MIAARFALLALVAAVPAMAQIQPLPNADDPHLQTVDYQAGQVVQLRSAPGFALMVELSPDEQVQNVALGDGSSWQVSVNKEGDRLFVKPTQAGAGTNMTVVTSVRVYHFELAAFPAASAQLPYTVQFRYPPRKAREADRQYVDVSAAARRTSRYQVGGDRQLRPASVSDDGQRTYIIWPKGASIPAVFAFDPFGKEMLVNGMMGTDDVYVVEGVPQKFAFRIDGSVAWAKRVKSRKGR